MGNRTRRLASDSFSATNTPVRVIDSGFMMRDHLYSALAYAILLMTCLAGVAHLNWWAGCIGACAMAMLSLIGRRVDHVSYVHRYNEVTDFSLSLSSIVNGSGAGLAAFVLGKGSAWMWGF